MTDLVPLTGLRAKVPPLSPDAPDVAGTGIVASSFALGLCCDPNWMHEDRVLPEPGQWNAPKGIVLTSLGRTEIELVFSPDATSSVYCAVLYRDSVPLLLFDVGGQINVRAGDAITIHDMALGRFTGDGPERTSRPSIIVNPGQYYSTLAGLEKVADYELPGPGE